MSSSLTAATFFLFGIHPVNTESAVKKNNMAGWHNSLKIILMFDSLLRDDKYVRSLVFSGKSLLWHVASILLVFGVFFLYSLIHFNFV